MIKVGLSLAVALITWYTLDNYVHFGANQLEVIVACMMGFTFYYSIVDR